MLDNWIYFIISGAVYIEKNGSRIGKIMRSGSIFGEKSIIDETPRSASGIATEKVLVLGVNASF